MLVKDFVKENKDAVIKLYDITSDMMIQFHRHKLFNNYNVLKSKIQHNRGVLTLDGEYATKTVAIAYINIHQFDEVITNRKLHHILDKRDKMLAKKITLVDWLNNVETKKCKTIDVYIDEEKQYHRIDIDSIPKKKWQSLMNCYVVDFDYYHDCVLDINAYPMKHDNARCWLDRNTALLILNKGVA